jgi:hypothetical protein
VFDKKKKRQGKEKVILKSISKLTYSLLPSTFSLLPSTFSLF